MKAFKSIGAIFLLLIMLLIGAKFIFFKSYIHFQKVQFRKSILAAPIKDLTEIMVDETDLFKDSKGIEWKENNKEVVVRGQYHEVISIKKEGNRFRVYIIPDKAENNLFQSYFTLDNTSGGRDKDQWLLLLCMNFIIPHATEWIGPEKQEQSLTIFSQPFHTHTFQCELIKPPILRRI